MLRQVSGQAGRGGAPSPEEDTALAWRRGCGSWVALSQRAHVYIRRWGSTSVGTCPPAVRYLLPVFHQVPHHAPDVRPSTGALQGRKPPRESGRACLAVPWRESYGRRVLSPVEAKGGPNPRAITFVAARLRRHPSGRVNPSASPSTPRGGENNDASAARAVEPREAGVLGGITAGDGRGPGPGPGPGGTVRLEWTPRGR